MSCAVVLPPRHGACRASPRAVVSQGTDFVRDIRDRSALMGVAPTGTLKPAPSPLESMADSWKSAKEEAAQKACPFVYHDLEQGTYGAAKREDDCGHFSAGRWVPHRAICMKADLAPEEMEVKEAAYLAGHPEPAPQPGASPA